MLCPFLHGALYARGQALPRKFEPRGATTFPWSCRESTLSGSICSFLAQPLQPLILCMDQVHSLCSALASAAAVAALKPLPRWEDVGTVTRWLVPPANVQKTIRVFPSTAHRTRLPRTFLLLRGACATWQRMSFSFNSRVGTSPVSSDTQRTGCPGSRAVLASAQICLAFMESLVVMEHKATRHPDGRG
jgi:hypothetical protein